jgi:hypothetical protein
MSYSAELAVNTFTNKIFRIESNLVSFDGRQVKTADITGYSFDKTEMRINGIKANKSYSIRMTIKDQKDLAIGFGGVALLTSAMQKHYEKITENLFKYVGKRIMNEAYKSLLEGKTITLANCKFSPQGLHITERKLFSSNIEHTVPWEDIDYKNEWASFIDLKSLSNKSIKTSFSYGSSENGEVLFHLLNWLYHDSDRIAAIYNANGIVY